MSLDPALKAHKRLIDCLFQECKPKHLQVNGKTTAGEMIKQLFGESESFEKIGTGVSSIEVGWAKIGDHRLPIMIHGFINSPNGPQSSKDFLECVNNFQRWLSIQRD